MAKIVALTLCLLAVGAHAQCADGSAPAASGCCAATNECPPGCISSSAMSSSPGVWTCTCGSCCGEAVAIDTSCPDSTASCDAVLQSQSPSDSMVGFFTLGSCTVCSGSSIACFASDQAANDCISSGMVGAGSMPAGASVTNGVLVCPGGGGSGGGGGGGVSDDPCFPSAATARRPNLDEVRLDALKVGDEILAVTEDGVVKADTVSSLSLADPDVAGRFYTFTTASGKNVTATADHHLAVGGACCSSLKQAKEVRVGETVWTVDRAAHKDWPPGEDRVVRIRTSPAVGRHSPVMTHGLLPLVGGVVTSFDTIGKVRLASYAVPVLQKTGAEGLFRKLFLKGGRKYIK